MTFPDYDRSILSISASLLEHYGAECSYAPLPELLGPLSARPRHIVLVILDGMGEAALRELLPEGAFLRAHRVATLSSVYPCTTTAATTSLYSALSPIEHGWLAWSCYFKEYHRSVDLFLNRDSYTHKRLKTSPAETFLRYPSIFARISAATGGRVRTCAAFPFQPLGLDGLDELYVNPRFEGQAARIEALLASPGESFSCLYSTDPDETQHERGVLHQSARDALSRQSQRLDALCQSARDALFIITADHGLIDVKETLLLNDSPEVCRHLVMPPSWESRALSLFVKRGREAAFESAFRGAYGRWFQLMPRAEVLSSGLLGRGAAHPKADDFLGDYLALATGGKALDYQVAGAPARERLIGQHAGLTEREMRVPLILVQKPSSGRSA